MNNIGLFVIPIRINKKQDTYKLYLDFLETIETAGYTHLYLGEHLTDPREDIQSSIVFASAILARTKKLKVALSVLPLPHYNIKLLIKQLEDLYRLSEGRLLIGFGKGALSSDASLLGFKNEDRNSLFQKKLDEFFNELEKSTFLSKIPRNLFFSTILSLKSIGIRNLYDKGCSAITSNFCHPKIKLDHSLALSNHINLEKEQKWHIIYNTLPGNLIEENRNLYHSVIKTYKYIYNKLGDEYARKIMLGDIDLNKKIDHLESWLFNGLNSSKDDINKHYLEMADNINLGFPIVNLFDCLEERDYIEFIYSLPKVEQDK